MSERTWANWAIARIEADYNRSADTHLIPISLPALPDIALYLKDESSHPTGSLKHRLARSLFLYALCNGWISEDRPVIEASSGSTAVSEAYFARMIGLPFIAIVPRATAAEKLRAIEFYGGQCHLVDSASETHAAGHRLAGETGGHFMDQFCYAERATDWRGNNNIADSVFTQMAHEPHPVPQWIVCGAGTGGTSATIGRYVRYHRLASHVCVADPEASVFHRHWRDRTVTKAEGPASLVEGIGRPQMEHSFLPDIVDQMIIVPDIASIAAARVLSQRLGKRVGGSTGTNLWACMQIATKMAQGGQAGSIVSILCDDGARYASTYYNEDWIAARLPGIADYEARVSAFFETGAFT